MLKIKVLPAGCGDCIVISFGEKKNIKNILIDGTYAVFIISMLKYLKTKPYQIGFAIIDTPLNPYKPDDKDDGRRVSENLANNFYRYLAENIKA